MMKLDSCKKKQLYECSFIKFTLKYIQKPITWVWGKILKYPRKDEHEMNCFMNDEIEQEKNQSQPEGKETS